MTLKELYESTLREIDRQMADRPTTPETALIWAIAAGEINEQLTQIKARENSQEKKPV